MSSDQPPVWSRKTEARAADSLIHIVTLGLVTGVGIVVGTFGSLAFSMGFVSVFWPGQAVQSVAGIWFGGWGAIAGALFPFISNSLAGSAPLPLSLAYVPANLAQGMISGWAFRFFKADPSLPRARDWIVWIAWGIIIPNVIGALWGTEMLLRFGLITKAVRTASCIGWFLGNSVPSLILGSLVLRFLSPLVVRSRAFVRSVWV